MLFSVGNQGSLGNQLVKRWKESAFPISGAGNLLKRAGNLGTNFDVQFKLRMPVIRLLFQGSKRCAGKRMARFYSLHVERDLFGGVVLRRQWGRIGTAGRTRLEPHEDEQAATMVLERIKAAKRRRGYVDALSGSRT
jgi:predicted DNA-binding WGR domain protein